MMEERDLGEVHRVGMEALIGALGPEDARRFVEQCRMGIRDYTHERHRRLGSPTVDEIADRLQVERNRKALVNASDGALVTRD